MGQPHQKLWAWFWLAHLKKESTKLGKGSKVVPEGLGGRWPFLARRGCISWGSLTGGGGKVAIKVCGMINRVRKTDGEVDDGMSSPQLHLPRRKVQTSRIYQSLWE